MPSRSKKQTEGLKRTLKTKVTGGWDLRDMDPNHYLKNAVYAIKKIGQSWQGCSVGWSVIRYIKKVVDSYTKSIGHILRFQVQFPTRA